MSTANHSRRSRAARVPVGRLAMRQAGRHDRRRRDQQHRVSTVIATLAAGICNQANGLNRTAASGG